MVRDEPVTIVDREVLKVLSTDTRMDIMKMLSEGGRTPSYVAKKLQKSDATIVEHLKVLQKAGLVKKTEAPGKKFVFYDLTERGRGIVSSKSRRLVIILSSSLISLGIGAGIIGTQLLNSMYAGSNALSGEVVQPLLSRAPEATDAALGSGVEEAAAKAIPTITQGGCILSTPPFWMTFGGIMLAISLVGLGFYFYKKQKMEEYRK